jgi:hypothetical protein
MIFVRREVLTLVLPKHKLQTVLMAARMAMQMRSNEGTPLLVQAVCSQAPAKYRRAAKAIKGLRPETS